MKKKYFISLFMTLVSFSLIAQRNVILIIADDLGTDYCGFYENHLDTVGMPNVRRLLNNGIRFTRAWSNPLCSPTRAGILTGRYSFRTGVGTAIGGPGSAVLDTAELTIPRLLNSYAPNAIAKATIGKWHLQLPMPATNYVFPNAMGYDHFEGNFTGTLNSYTNWVKITNGVSTTVTNYATTETVDNAISWINAQQNKPFFLWLAFNAPHSPYHLPPPGLYSDTTLSGTVADINSNPKKYFKASVEALDHEIGRLLDSLVQFQKMDSTDIIFIGDNGDDQIVSQTAGAAKGSIYQSGVCVPVIISGPSVVNPNRVSDALINLHDLFATILELFGDTTWQNLIPVNKPVDSKSIMPLIKNTATTIRQWVFTEVFRTPSVAGDGKAMRNAEYKLLDFDLGSQKFFNLILDSNETTDLLTGSMSAIDYINYTYLCNEMTSLVGSGNFCSLNGIGNHQIDKNPLKVYPNPFSSFINVCCESGKPFCELRNTTGQLMYSGTNIGEQNFSALPQGFYYIKITDKKSYFKKLIK